MVPSILQGEERDEVLLPAMVDSQADGGESNELTPACGGCKSGPESWDVPI